ncbi:Maf family protein [Carnimonas nigrificans]|uniref:Maf family protein n=1 Tax=Carnimonas nigrificans TaxID=64323 RepID=UPI000471A2B4|nr:nucleoside triphosphate pyrophosphatase [Carnimonas nigrificans]
MTQPALILASSSPYRRMLLERLQLPFITASPDIDESRRPGESPSVLAERLAVEKARALAAQYPDAVIIGSDQVCASDDTVLGKPGSAEKAHEQLARFSGRTVDFYTGLCVINTANGGEQVAVERSIVTFRTLTASQINAYVEREQPLDCAGAFRMEGLGIALFERIEGDDPNTLIGLPLIRLCQMLSSTGIDPLAP